MAHEKITEAARRDNDAYVIEVNANPSEITPLAHLFLEGPSGQAMQEQV